MPVIGFADARRAFSGDARLCRRGAGWPVRRRRIAKTQAADRRRSRRRVPARFDVGRFAPVPSSFILHPSSLLLLPPIPTIALRMGRLNDVTYAVVQFLGRWIYALSIKGEVIRPHLAERAGGYVLAVTHLSHLEPFVLTILVRRKIDWMARVEFYRWRPFAWMLRAMDAFPVNRFGVPVRAIRTAIERARAGRIVGI